MEYCWAKALSQSLTFSAVVAVTARKFVLLSAFVVAVSVRRFVLLAALLCFCYSKVYTHMFMCTVYVRMYTKKTHTHMIDHTLSTSLHRI